MIKDLWDDGWQGRVIICLVGSLPFLIALMIWAVVVENNQWEAFKAAHDCKIVGQMTGDVATTIAPVLGGNGGVAIGTSVSPSKTGWQCNNGMTYWR